jgi:Fic family protein
MSAQIRQERKAYYDLLEHTQKGGTHITACLTWFLECLGRAINGAETLLAGVLTKARFWENIGASPLNDR